MTAEPRRAGRAQSATADDAGRRPPAIAIDDLSVHYGDRVALQRATLAVASGRLMALVGPSGCGKSSLLRSVNRLNDSIPDCRVRGRIRLDDFEVLVPDTELRLLRRRVGMLFQQPNPFPLSIRDNLLFPLREHGLRNRTELADRCEHWLRAVGLWPEVADLLERSALTLSGGQQQRLCLARALALGPEVLLLDEPCSALDPIASETVESLIDSLRGRYTILMVTHNLAQARRLADDVTVCWVDQGCGCVLESGSRDHIFLHATDPLIRAYCGGDKG